MTMTVYATTPTSTAMAARMFLTLLLWLASHAFAYLHPLSPQSLSSSRSSSSSSSLRTLRPSAADWGRRRQRHHDHNYHGRGGATTTAMRQSASSSSSQSANDNLGGFHYDTVPRGTSYISQISKHDLSERRRMKRSAPRRSSFTTTNPATPTQLQTMRTTAISPNNNEKYIRDSYADTPDKENLQSMTFMLHEMRKSQTYQEEDIRSLSNKLADVAVRLGQQQQHHQMPQPKERVKTKEDEGEEEGNIDRRNKSYGKSLDGEFHQRIKNAIDDLDEYHDDDDENNYTSVNYIYGANKKRRTRGRINNDVDDYDEDDNTDSYTKSKVVQLESRIRRMDKLLRSMEGNVNAQMEYVDQMVNQRLDDIEDDVAASSPLPPPRDQEFMEERLLPHPPLPHPSSSSYTQQGPPPLFPPPPPPPSQELYANPYNYNEMDDDGRTYYQERNYNDPNYRAPPPPHQMPQQTRQSNSANERSRGYHYNERNTSFISAFSKADNERRRQLQPLCRRGGKNEENTNARWNDNRVEPSGGRLPRGVRYPPNREFGSFSRVNAPQPPILGRMMMMQDEYFEEGSGGYFDAPYLYDEDRPIMLEGEGYFLYNDNIFEH